MENTQNINKNSDIVDAAVDFLLSRLGENQMIFDLEQHLRRDFSGNIYVRNKKKTKTQEILRLYEKGLSVATICARLNVNKTTVYRAIAKSGGKGNH